MRQKESCSSKLSQWRYFYKNVYFFARRVTGKKYTEKVLITGGFYAILNSYINQKVIAKKYTFMR